jgi:hypothetical protein
VKEAAGVGVNLLGPTGVLLSDEAILSQETPEQLGSEGGAPPLIESALEDTYKK